MMKLWSSQASPFARKARIVVIEKSLEDQVEEIFIQTSPIATDQSLAAQNPLGKLPALTIDLGDEEQVADEDIVVDSRVICQYLDSLGHGAVLHPSGNVRHSSLVAIADGILDAAVSIVYEAKARPESLRSEEWVNAQWLKIENTLRYIDKKYWDVLAHFNMASIGVVCALEYLDFRMDERQWRQYAPELAKWHELQKERESFVATRPKG